MPLTGSLPCHFRDSGCIVLREFAQFLRRSLRKNSDHAFGVDAKRVESKAVLEALRRPQGVAVFVRFYEPLLDPDPFYLAMLREDTIVFVVAADAILDPIP